MDKLINIGDSKKFREQPFERLFASIEDITLSAVDTESDDPPEMRYELLIQDLDEDDQLLHFSNPGAVRAAFLQAERLAKQGLNAETIAFKLLP